MMRGTGRAATGHAAGTGAEHHDVVVVGSGSGGGVVASRLSEDADRSVLLLESGPDFPDEATDPPDWFALGSFTAGHATGSWPPSEDLDWRYESEPLANGRRLRLRRGRLVGGTSMANGSIAVRPRPSDMDSWVTAGATGWEWERVLPHLERVERELHVHATPRERWLPVQELMIRGWEELGFAWADDLNAPDAWDGVVGPWPRSRRNEVRLGSLNTYVRAARPRPNFAVRGGATVERVLLDGTRAVGVSYVDAEGRRRVVGADHVVLAGGAYGSPAILLRSGIGPADELRALGIAPVADLPVGHNLMEHAALPFRFRVDPVHAAVGWPALAAVGRGEGWWGIPQAWDEEEGIVQVNFCLATTEGPDGGRVRLGGAGVGDPLVIDHGFQGVVDGGSFDAVWADAQRLLATDALRGAHARDLQEGMVLRERLLQGLGTSAHPAGGCSIGTVLDPDLSVRGVEGVTVADASVFPRHATNNPNVLIFAVGEIAAATLRVRSGAPGPPPADIYQPTR